MDEYSNINHHSDKKTKIALFRSLFTGREDVFVRRFESRRTGKCGYSPFCRNEWVKGICEKPHKKCGVCPHRSFVPVSDSAIRAHLTGKDSFGKPFVMAAYPMLLDEKCRFLVLNFTQMKWMDDVRTFMSVCWQEGISAAVEMLESGKAARLWFFFSEAVPAQSARQLGSFLITGAMCKRPQMGLNVYDHLTPDQNTLSANSFGRYVPLPLQKQEREKSNTVFLDETLQTCKDQWAFMAGLERMSPAELTERVEAASRHGSVMGLRSVGDSVDKKYPWYTPLLSDSPAEVKSRLPDKIEMTLTNQLTLSKRNLPPFLHNLLLRTGAFLNPDYYQKEAMRLPVYSLARIISCAEDLTDELRLPRGCANEVKTILKKCGVACRIKDMRCKGIPLDVTFLGTLRRDQQKAANKMIKYNTGVLAATTAFGKTVLGAWMIAARKVNTLVVVSRRQLMTQWIDRLCEFLDIDKKEIGALGGGRKKLKGKIDVALLQSLVRDGSVNEHIADYGQVIVDECHHISAPQFETALRQTQAKYILGLSATPTRKDGHHPIIFMQCGAIRCCISALEHSFTNSLRREVIVRPSDFQSITTVEYQSIIGAMIHDQSRNDRICSDIASAVQSGARPLVLSERREHLERLRHILEARGLEIISVLGGMSKKQVSELLERFRRTPSGILLSTGRFVGEGFDEPCLDCLFITLPVSWKGTITQYVGRLHRRYQGKRTVRVFDYADLQLPMASRMFDKRCEAYKAQGYSILLPAEAQQGWPANVPLPTDREWVQSHSAGIKRLIADGMDRPLAALFVQATEPFTEVNGTGTDRARSASEAFLYQRLQSLPQTQGCFKVNQKLPLPFRGNSSMEVDFLCSDARLVIEVDGERHFSDPEAYRRDREKDFLLQEAGYLVLRFAAEDLGKHLNEVLDRIIRCLSSIRWLHHCN